uniref:Protein CDV3 homolog n=1 Tax=Clastoptera arizonana TaxID=38151 RepID=A0A1B6C3J4_9HEMI
MAFLDDFFAKKDKKKIKKNSLVNDIEKGFEVRENCLGKVNTPTVLESESLFKDEEWKEYEEEKKDYSGLKILNTTFSEEIDLEGKNDFGTEDPSGVSIPNPWKCGSGPQKTSTGPSRSGSGLSFTSQGTYRPPHARAHYARSVHEHRAVLDINNEDSFPTLSTMKKMAGGFKKRSVMDGYDKVTHGKTFTSRPNTTRRLASTDLPTYNKYSAIDSFVNSPY